MANEAVGTGTTLVAGTSSAFTTALYPQSLTFNDTYGRPKVEYTNLKTTGGRQYLPGDLYEPGSISVEAVCDPQNQPPLGVVETWTVEFPDGATFAASGWINGYTPQVGTEELIKVNFTIELTGNITWADT